jgi:DNA (cytosine-5)-methyltransferase 1
MQAGVTVRAGFDNDPGCRYPYEANLPSAEFVLADVRDLTGADLVACWSDDDDFRLLAGCAPCQPFSPYRGGSDTSTDEKWPLLREMLRLVQETEPHFVTMENVPRLRSSLIFEEFTAGLEALGFYVDHRSCRCEDYGLAQSRRRLVLVASRLGPVEIPDGNSPVRTVRDVIGDLPAIESGGVDSTDQLHRARQLSELNLKRIKASKPGGTWEDWPAELRAPCHRKPSGASYRNVYARMKWDSPSPTITTLFHNFGTGRFGHPEQNRPISIREAAMLQGFPRDYEFVDDDAPVHFSNLGRLIGNAVPPPLGALIGGVLHDHLA